LGRIGTIDYDPAALIRDKEWTQVPALRLDASTTILVFRPTPGAIPELRPTLKPVLESPTVNLDTTWQVEPRRAVANGTIHWSRKEPLSLLEFTVPGVQLLEVRGSEVGRWNQSGEQAYVWLRKPMSEGELEWTGTIPVASGQQPVSSFAFEAAIPRALNARLGTNIVRISPVEGWKMQTDKDRGWAPLIRKDDVVAFQATNPGANPVRVLLTAAAPPTPNGTSGRAVPLPQSRSVLGTSQTPAVNAASAESQPTFSQTDVSSETGLPWPLPVYAIIGWCVAIAILSLLLIRFPGTTWPEQFALIVGLFGAAILGQWWIGVAGWIAARAMWLSEAVRHSSSLKAQTNSK
jgi:hypothetical protein